MPKIVSKGHKTWKDGSVMNYTITDDGVLTISGKLPESDYVDIRSRAPFRHLVIEDGIRYVGHKNFAGWEEIEELTLAPSVKNIGVHAFRECTNLKTIHFLEGLTRIYKEAFYECSSLEKVMLPASLHKLGEFSFFWCDSLKKVKIPGSVKTIEHKAFAGCKNLTEVVLGNGLENISDEAFCGCSLLEKINFPKSLSYIGRYAFQQSSKLHDIVFANKNITLGSEAFGSDEGDSIIGEDGNKYNFWISNIRTNVNPVTIAPTNRKLVNGDVIVPGKVVYKGKEYAVTVIAAEAFSGSQELKSVQLPDSILKIEEYAFLKCGELKAANLGKSLLSIGGQAFDRCGKLESVQLGESLEEIGMEAFSECRKLKELHFPETLKTLGCRALDYTAVLDDRKGAVYIDHVLCGYKGYLPPHSWLEVREGTTVIAERAFTDVGNIEAVIFPNTVRYIGYCAFVECKDLKYIKLPKSLVDIGSDAFNYTSIQEVVAPWKKPIGIDYNAFPESAVIYIPKGSKDAYSKAEFWKDYKLIEK
jgi:hypothetical protein